MKFLLKRVRVIVSIVSSQFNAEILVYWEQPGKPGTEVLVVKEHNTQNQGKVGDNNNNEQISSVEFSYDDNNSLNYCDNSAGLNSDGNITSNSHVM